MDPVFEFEAPKYIDFATSVENETEDVWFGMFERGEAKLACN